MAEDFHWISGGGQPATSVDDRKLRRPSRRRARCAAPSCAPAVVRVGSCCNLGCDACPCRGIVGFFGFDSFKGISDGDYPSNFGAVTGLNACLPVPGLQRLRHRLAARHELRRVRFRRPRVRPSITAESQQQIFVTTGFFHKAEGDRRLSFGVGLRLDDQQQLGSVSAPPPRSDNGAARSNTP